MGSNIWLAHAWNSTGLTSLLPELLGTKVYVWRSAGSMIFARKLDRWPADFDDEEDLELFELDAAAPAAPLFDWFFVHRRRVRAGRGRSHPGPTHTD